MGNKKQAEAGKPSNATLLGLRLYFGLWGRLAPAATAQRMLRLFAHPPKNKLKPPHLELLARAQPFSLRQQSQIEQDQWINLAGYRWSAAPGKRRVLLLHGWRGKAADYYKLVPMLEDCGFCVDALDFAAHGRSEGTLCSEPDMEAALRLYLAQEGMPYAIVAHSLGAAAVALALCGAGRPATDDLPAKLVLLAHPVRLRHAFEASFRMLGIPPATQRAVYAYTEARFGFTMSQIDLTQLARPLPAQTLSLYVPDDEEVPIEHTLDFGRAHPHVELACVADATHNRIMRNLEARQRIVLFLTDNNPPAAALLR